MDGELARAVDDAWRISLADVHADGPDEVAGRCTVAVITLQRT